MFVRGFVEGLNSALTKVTEYTKRKIRRIDDGSQVPFRTTV